MKEMYFVIENEWNGFEFVQTVLFSGTQEECLAFEDAHRKSYNHDRTTCDCFTRSESELNQIEDNRRFYETLTADQKADFIVVDGKKYVRAIYERMHKGE